MWEKGAWEISLLKACPELWACESWAGMIYQHLHRLLARQLVSALKLQAVVLNWLQFSVFLDQRCWALWLPGCCLGCSSSPATGGSPQQLVVRLVPVFWITSYACSFKWVLRMVEDPGSHYCRFLGERQRSSPKLLFNSIRIARNQNGKLWIELKRVCLGGAAAQGLCMQFCALQRVFEMQVLKWIHSDLIETWNLGS